MQPVSVISKICSSTHDHLATGLEASADQEQDLYATPESAPDLFLKMNFVH